MIFEDIISYISMDSEENARLFVSRIIDSVETMALFPYSGRIVPELNNELIKEKVFNNYRIIYRIKDNVMEVARVLHSARELPELG
ncbi:type II toxin-antitoxin system RelE/ParE family toxin [Oceanobacillus caeni]|uniref:Plasmid stabilization protein n=2 Tax=Bacillales TaxID=1385 RepID=A0ABR5MHT3_9BACI|nr:MULTISPECIES: type II toxin-antitoxin system RelE/ParE family toxin [Bacillaceae]KKE78913.1 plasmid stabilization protein [Bacilli bacterium VT-13-104]PZD84401.1 type II toxin-antitoxin system RelE/ParE family toxin [Bacilli bacterium]KPH73567.1 plasmid stabilization protein [Oceanobacillus caeni]MBU8791484.1 type II toxin-antitoxin system RelE/ParE family toxin [Oceanobacillus caeni]MCR1833659.1 type II toxin-antitoxin system RelE/ParE family toxin [Oceanobacillus caeni]